MKKYTLYAIVSVSGAVILALEIVGTRILGPYYGVSLYLWSALISVTLLSLSLGYFLGGRRADKGITLKTIAIIFAIAGLWIILTPFMSRFVSSISYFIGLRFGVLAAAIILFVPPLTLLGMISPMAVKLNANSLQHVGRAAGNLYAVSTIASVVAAVTTGFFLIPNLGVTLLLLVLGFIAVLAACVLFLAEKKISFFGTIIILAIAVSFLSILTEKKLYAGSTLLDVAQSTYGEIAVTEKDGDRSLLIDGAVHTTVNAETGQNVLAYGLAMELVDDLTDLDNDMLMIGLGGGALFNYFTEIGWNVDAAEIDPVVIRFAEKYFNLMSNESVYCVDGRQLLNKTEKQYDVILLDAFGSSSIPFHLSTSESFKLMKSRLSEDGLLAMNVMSIGWKSKLVNSLSATLHQHFNNVLALPIHEPPNALTNVILLASNREMNIPEEWLPRPFDFLYDEYLHWRVVQKNHAWNNRFEPEFEKGQILTDDKNPVDIWAEAINLQSRLVFKN